MEYVNFAELWKSINERLGIEDHTTDRPTLIVNCLEAIDHFQYDDAHIPRWWADAIEHVMMETDVGWDVLNYVLGIQASAACTLDPEVLGEGYTYKDLIEEGEVLDGLDYDEIDAYFECLEDKLEELSDGEWERPKRMWIRGTFDWEAA